MSRIGILDSLEREQKDLLVTWIEALPIKLVLEKVASAPPEGFNIRTHITSLRPFYQRERNFHTRENIDFARGACMSSNDAEVIREASIAALTHHAFEVGTTLGFGEFELSRARSLAHGASATRTEARTTETPPRKAPPRKTKTANHGRD